MGEGHNPQPNCHLLLFHEFKQCNMKFTTAYHPGVQEIDKLLAKVAFKQSTNGAGFYSNVFVVPQHIGGPWLTLSNKQFIHYIHITF